MGCICSLNFALIGQIMQLDDFRLTTPRKQWSHFPGHAVNRNLKFIEAQKTRLLANLLRDRGDGIVGFGHFSRLSLRHALLQPMDSCESTLKYTNSNKPKKYRDI